MRKQEEDVCTKCNKCNRWIKTQNYLIHLERCNGPSKIFSNNKFKQKIRNQQEFEEKIPCPFCSYPQTLKQLDTHPLECRHRQVQCQRCHTLYPLSLHNQHLSVCPARISRNNNPQNNNFQQGSNQRIQIRQRNIMPENIFSIFTQLHRGRNSHYQRQREQNPFNSNEQRIINPFSIMIRRNQQRPRNGQFFGFIRLIEGLANNHLRGNNRNSLSQNEINSMPIIKYKIKNQPELCTICYCQFEQGQDVMTLPCTHLYHPQCISKWLQKNGHCPVCKHNCKNNQENNNRQRSNRQRNNRQRSSRNNF